MKVTWCYITIRLPVTGSCSDSGSTPGRLCKLCVDLTDYFVYLKDNQVYKVLWSGLLMYSYEYLYLEINYMHTHTHQKQMLYKRSIKMARSLIMRITCFNKKNSFFVHDLIFYFKICQNPRQVEESGGEPGLLHSEWVGLLQQEPWWPFEQNDTRGQKGTLNTLVYKVFNICLGLNIRTILARPWTLRRMLTLRM